MRVIVDEKAKPFIKWVGGKRQLIEQLENLLPSDFDEWEDVRYIEPFVGGGAMLFHVLRRHKNITSAVINDINADLMKCWIAVRDYPEELIKSLKEIEDKYFSLATEESKRAFYYQIRECFNEGRQNAVEQSVFFMFLNRTCFNGLYRVNRHGRFNVPFGRYKQPKICDAETIFADSRALSGVEIMSGDFWETGKRIKGNTFFYIDPPYRPLNATSSFNDYSKENFDDDAQRRLKRFCDNLDRGGIKFMLSNSDCLGKDGKDRFFDNLYRDYRINRVWAARNVSADPAKRGKLTEIVVENFR